MVETKTDLSETYYEIKRLENEKEKYHELYCIKYNITASELKDIIVSGGTKLADAMLKKIIKTDGYLDEILSINKEISCLSKYLNKEISIMLEKGDDTPVIIFLKDFKDLETKKNRTFMDIARLLYIPEATVKRKYYEYKNALK